MPLTSRRVPPNLLAALALALGLIGGLFVVTHDWGREPGTEPVSATSPVPTTPTPTAPRSPAASPSATATQRATPRATKPKTPSLPPTPATSRSRITPRPAEPTRGLTTALASRVQDAMTAAARSGVTLRINSGWRSRSEQAQLWREAVKKYGSTAAARHWVLPPDESAHPRGRAVDMSPPSGAKWLSRNGERFGLCRRYTNEPWHFEALIPRGGNCPTPTSGAEG